MLVLSQLRVCSIMEVAPLKKLEQLEFSLDSVTDLSSPSVSSSSPAVATFSCVDGVTELRFLQSDSTHCFNFDLASAQVDVDSLATVMISPLKRFVA